MTDRYGRTIRYLRLSVTDLCSYRCVYCMAEEGVEKRRHGDVLSIEELAEIGAAAVRCGVDKIRLTGGEPLVRRGILTLCERLRALPGLRELTVTTNGAALGAMAAALRAAGVDRLNVSLDTLRPERFRAVTRRGELDDVLRGLDAADAAGFTGTKLNVVLLGGVNDDEIPALCALTKERPIEMRFIELMPIGDALYFGPEACIPVDTVLERMPGLQPLPRAHGSVARRYTLPGAVGTVGLISPVSCSFCSECNRVRLTADGFMKPCLHSAEEFPLRGLHGAALRDAIRAAVNAKPEAHIEFTPTQRSKSARNMNQIGG